VNLLLRVVPEFCTVVGPYIIAYGIGLTRQPEGEDHGSR
jgi:hypothetical protein